MAEAPPLGNAFVLGALVVGKLRELALELGDDAVGNLAGTCQITLALGLLELVPRLIEQLLRRRGLARTGAVVRVDPRVVA